MALTANDEELLPEAQKLQQELGLHSGYTPEAVAQALKVNVSTVYRWLQSGQMNASQVGKQWRVTVEDVKSFVQQQNWVQQREAKAKLELARMRKLRPDRKWRVEHCTICRNPIVTDGVRDQFAASVVHYSTDGDEFFACDDPSSDCKNSLIWRLYPPSSEPELEPQDIPFE